MLHLLHLGSHIIDCCQSDLFRVSRSYQTAKSTFVERLLALECVSEIGGPSYTYWAYDFRYDTTPDWSSTRFACLGCLRLLSHIYFTNHHIIGIEFGKPEPGSPCDEFLTSWEPSLRGKK